jgi:hypothetical protein
VSIQLESSHGRRPTRVSTATETVAGTFRLNVLAWRCAWWASGQNSLPVCVYDASVALQAGKTVTRVVLPDVSSGVASGSQSLHVFAVTIQ